MKTLCFILIISIYSIANSQEFSFQMTFTDAIGNSDSLIMGFDENATDTMDAEFGEINIKDSTLNPVFDVTITNEMKKIATIYDTVAIFHTKKQISKKNCETFSEPIAIDIKCDHWPVTATWDNTKFTNDSCLEGSVITSLHQGLWWDVGTPSDLYYITLKSINKVTFTSNADEHFHTEDVAEAAYINSEGDTISVFWVALGTNEIIKIGTLINDDSPDNSIVLYPNPCKNKLNFTQVGIQTISVMDYIGKTVLTTNTLIENEVDLSGLSEGIYFIKLRSMDGEVFTKKIIKID